MFNTALDWLLAHQWLIVALIINVGLRLRTAEQYVEILERYRAGAALVAALRFMGLDPVGAIRGLQIAVNARATMEATRGGGPLPPDTLRTGLPPGGSDGSIGGAEGSDPRGGGQ